MTKDEALKLALEALKQIDEAMPFPVAKLAQKAIREALAQPEQRLWYDIVPCLRCGHQCHPTSTKAQPEQEPVSFLCLRCVTPKKCAIHGCSPNTWPAETQAQPEIPMQNNNPGLEWDKIPKSFNDWWDSDYDPTGNPFSHETPAYWAWAGWKAAQMAQPEQEPVAGQPLPCPFCGHIGLDFSDGNTYRWGIASCGGCGASCGDIRREYPDEGKWHSEAIAEWNKRTTPPQRKPLIHEEVDAFKAWFDAWWLGDKEHGQVVPTQGHELFANYMSEYTLAFGAWMAAKEAAHGIKE